MKREKSKRRKVLVRGPSKIRIESPTKDASKTIKLEVMKADEINRPDETKISKIITTTKTGDDS